MPGGDTKSSIEFLINIGKLKHLKRTGWVENNIPDPETVSGHMYRMSMAAMMLDSSDNVNTDRVLRMCLVHDAAECIIGDLTPHCGVSEHDKHTMELNAMKKLSSDTSQKMSDEMVTLFQEYEDQKTPEAVMVKDLDKFDMILQAYQYEVAGNEPGSLEAFFSSTKGAFKTNRVKSWVEELYSQRNAFSKSSS